MKKIILSILLLIGCNVTLQARLGETPAAIEKVLGQPFKNAWDVQRWYVKWPYSVYIQFENVNGTNMAVLEVWRRLDGKPISVPEQLKLVTANVDLNRVDINNPPIAKYNDGWKMFTITTRRWMGLPAYKGS